MQEWPPLQAWWMDLLKSVITFIVGAVLTLLIVDRIQVKRAQKREREDVSFRMRLEALREFDRTSATYEVAALSAYTDLYQWEGKPKTESMLTYEGRAYGSYLAALGEVERRFTGDRVRTAITELRRLHKQRHELYDKWVDTRLDREADTPIYPKQDRARFDELLEKARGIRISVVTDLESSLLDEPGLAHGMPAA